MTNFTQYDSFDLYIHGRVFRIVNNYITPEYAGITINGNTYDVYLNESLLIDPAPEDLFYMKLKNISIVPAMDTVRFKLYRAPNQLINESLVYGMNSTTNLELYGGARRVVNLFDIGTQLYITPSKNTTFALTVNNISASKAPALPSGYLDFSLFNISIRNKSNSAALAINMSTGYDCGNSSIATQPFVYHDGRWSAVQGAIYNATACQVSFRINESQIVAVLEKPIQNTTSATTSIAQQQPLNPPSLSSIVQAIVTILKELFFP